MDRTGLCYLLVLFSYASSMPSSSSSDQGTCRLGDNVYQIGESWHPVLEPTGEDRCFTCRCNAPNNIECDRMPCLPLQCEHTVRLENSCCPVCAQQNKTTIHHSYLSSSEFSSVSTSAKSNCRFHGQEYYDGQTVPGERLYNGKDYNECVQCTCSGGLIYCTRSCPDPACPNPVVREGYCCPVCTQDDTSISETNDISLADVSLNGEELTDNFPPILESGSDHLDSRNTESFLEDYGCVLSGEKYYHGQSWHPVLRPFGKVNCVMCTCTLGVINCDRVQCPLEDEMPCKNPSYVRGECCRACPDIIDSSDSLDNDREPQICLNEFQTHFFYSYKPPVVYTTGEGHIISYAVEDIAREIVRISQWTINLGIIQEFLVEDVPSENFERATVTEDHPVGRFQLIGTTTKRRFEKLIRREAKIERRCKEECLDNVLKLTKVLRVSEIQRSLNCSQPDSMSPERRRNV